MGTWDYKKTMKVFSAALLISAIAAIELSKRGDGEGKPPKGEGKPPKGEDMPPMGEPSCAERAFEGLWMATDADGNDNLDAAEFGAVVDYGCAEDSECTPEDAEMAKGWFDEVTGGEPVPKDEVKAFMFEMGAEEFESENDSELCHMADEVEAYLDGECSGGSGGEGPPEVLLQIAKDAAKEKKGKKGGKKGGKKEKKEKKEGGKKEKKEKKEERKKRRRRRRRSEHIVLAAWSRFHHLDLDSGSVSVK